MKQTKHLIILAWEYPTVASPGGRALSRRIGQVSEGFADAGWKVTVIHRDNIGENVKEFDPIVESTPKGNNLIRYSIKSKGLSPSLSSNKYFRKLATLYITLFKGDRTYDWAEKIEQLAYTIATEEKIDLILSFYTPKGPILAGKILKDKTGLPWVVDLQDRLNDGYTGLLLKLGNIWCKKYLKSADVIVHVSPEWAALDGAVINKNIQCLRHAIPTPKVFDITTQKTEGKLSFIYTGSFNPEKQPIDHFLSAMMEINARGISKCELTIAASEVTYKKLLGLLPQGFDPGWIRWLGYLSPEQMHEAVIKSDGLLLLSWVDFRRQVVPSKLYEYMMYNKPILAAGKDSGGIVNLLKEWGHPISILETKDQITKAISNALEGNYNNFIQLKNCQSKPLFLEDLINNYLSIADNLITDHEK